MRRNSGGCRTFIAMSMTVLAAMVGIALFAAVLVAPTSTGHAATSAAQDGDELGSFATSLFESLAEGVSGAVTEELVGWGLSAMGLSEGDDESAALAEINSDLNEIIDELAVIEQELAQLTAAIQQLDCDTLTANTSHARGFIDSLSSTYKTFVDTAAGTSLPPSVPPISDMTAWADEVTDDITGVFAQIVTINDALLPAGSAQGIIEACLQPGVIAPPAAYEIDDRTYYDQVQNLTDFYYGYQAKGLLLVQEAYHFLAQQASGVTGDPTDPGAVCTPPVTDAEVALLCTAAIDDTNSVYMFLGHQLTLAGAPYSDDYVITMQGATGFSPVIWVKSLEDFTQRNGGGCAYPLTSMDPCGITVGNHPTAGEPFDVTYMYYDNWEPADADNLNDLIIDAGNKRLFDYLEPKGFANLQHKVIITRDTFSFTMWQGRTTDFEKATGRAMCFLDMNGGAYRDLHDDIAPAAVTCSSDILNAKYVWVIGDCNGHWLTGNGNPDLDNPVPPFIEYKMYPSNCVDDGEFNPTPGWLLSSDNYKTHDLGATSNNFRWPVTHAGNLSCSQGRSATNPAGVYTRCGEDFDSWFNEQVTRPVTCAGTIVGMCGDKVNVALTGRSAGEWSSPVTAGDVKVTLDGDTVRKITGTVKLPSTRGDAPARVTFKVKRVGGKHKFYTGTVKIKIGGHRAFVVPLRRADIVRHEDGTVSGQHKWRNGRYGTHTLTWSVRDNPA